MQSTTMIFRLPFKTILLFGFLSGSVCAMETESTFEKLVEPALAQHCVKCHGNTDRVEGKANLFNIKQVGDLKRDPELLQSLIDALEFEAMPPEDEPALDANTR